MGKLTLSQVNKLGDADPKYGQTWWGKVNEQTEPVMFNTLDGEFEAGDVLEFEEAAIKQSKKGSTYHRLKKVKKAGSILAGEKNAPQDDELLLLVKENNDMLRKLLGEEPKAQKQVDKVFEPTQQQEEEPIDLNEIPF